MPLLEALDFNCPVLCSDIETHREILEDAALYFYPLVPEEINIKWNWS
jgi:glycosyltransferase involved in cell wall biosynthesis